MQMPWIRELIQKNADHERREIEAARHARNLHVAQTAAMAVAVAPIVCPTCGHSLTLEASLPSIPILGMFDANYLR